MIVPKRRKKKFVFRLAILCMICVGIFLIVSNISKKEVPEGIKESESNTKNKYVTISTDGIKQNISSKLKESKRFEDLDITELNLTQSDGMTNLKGYITNNTNETQEERKINILLMDDQGNEITRMGAHIKTLKAGETTLLNASVTFDYTNAYDVVFQRQ